MSNLDSGVDIIIRYEFHLIIITCHRLHETTWLVDKYNIK